MKNSVRWPSVIVCAAPFPPSPNFSSLSVPLFPPFHPAGREREGIKACRFIALQSRAALPIAGKFKPCHRGGGQFFLGQLCLLGDRPRSRKSRPPPSLRLLLFSRGPFPVLPILHKRDFVFFSSRLDCKLPGRGGKKEGGYPLCCFRIESNRACRRSFINPRSPIPLFSDLSFLSLG